MSSEDRYVYHAIPKGDVQAALDAGAMCTEVEVIDVRGVPYAAVPEKVKLKNLEHLLTAPKRIEKVASFEEPDSFCAYVKDFKSPLCRIYGNIDAFRITAVLDDNVMDAPHWGDHSAEVKLRTSPEWNDWMKADCQSLSQSELAEFLEEHIEQISTPDATDLLSGIRAVQISSNSKLTAVQREGGDINFAYEKTTSAGTTTSSGKIPAYLTLLIAPFRSWNQVTMTVYLKYRYHDNRLDFILTPMRAKELQAKSFHEVRKHVEQTLGLPVLI